MVLSQSSEWEICHIQLLVQWSTLRIYSVEFCRCWKLNIINELNNFFHVYLQVISNLSQPQQTFAFMRNCGDKTSNECLTYNFNPLSPCIFLAKQSHVMHPKNFSIQHASMGYLTIVVIQLLLPFSRLLLAVEDGVFWRIDTERVFDDCCQICPNWVPVFSCKYWFAVDVLLNLIQLVSLKLIALRMW